MFFTSSMFMAASKKKKTVDNMYKATIYTGTASLVRIYPEFSMFEDGGMIWSLPLQATQSRVVQDTVINVNKTSYIDGYAYLISNTTAALVTGSNIRYNVMPENEYNFSTSNALVNTLNSAYLSRAFKCEPKFFNAVPYTGTGSAVQWIPHNLGVQCGMMIIKRTNSTSNWLVWHKDFSASANAYLDTTAVNTTTFVGSTNVVGDNFGVSGSNGTNNASGGNYIAYLFAHDDSPDSVIKCGSYTGNGSASGPVIDLGWEPQFVLIKKFTGNTTATNWIVYDDAMPQYHTILNGTAIPVVSAYLSTNTSGFSITSTATDVNTSGANYAYMAIRKSDNIIADPEGISIGDPFGGGYYAGIIRTSTKQDNSYYWLIVAPKATGEAPTTLQLKTVANTTANTSYINSGWDNTEAMMTDPAAHPAGKFCRDLSIGGFIDWYLPSKDEFELLYFNFRPSTTAPNASYGINWSAHPPRPVNHTTSIPPQTSAIPFRTGGSEEFMTNTYYWASTEVATTANALQLFSTGVQTSTSKTSAYYVRAVRRIKVGSIIQPALNIGDPYGGGYYAGIIGVGSDWYRLIISSKSLGATRLGLKTTNTLTPDTSSNNDGWSNTLAMIAIGASSSPAANYCRGLNINGFADWYLPSKDELELLYSNFKPTTDSNHIFSGINPSAYPPKTSNYTTTVPAQTSLIDFQDGGSEALTRVNVLDQDNFWSSTEDSTGLKGWIAKSNNGEQGTQNKTAKWQVRAVRREKIII